MGTNKNIGNVENLAAQFQYTIEMSQEAVFWLGYDGRFSYVNEQACRSLGYTKDELLSLYLWDIDPDFPIERWHDHWENLKKAGTKTFETRHRRKDGRIFAIEVSACQVVFEGKEFHAAYVRDITARKKITEELQKSEARYRSLFEYVPDGILVADQNSYYLDANPMMCSMLGYLREELIGLHASDIVSPHEIKHIRPALDQIKIESEHSRIWQFRRKDGSTFDAEVRVNEMPDGNLLAVVRDITVRQQEEEQQQKLEKKLQQSHKMEALGTMAGGIAHDFNNLLSIISGNTDIIKHKLKLGSPSGENLEFIEETTVRAKDLVKQILSFSRQEVRVLVPVDLSVVVEKTLKLLRSTTPAQVEIKGPVVPKAIFVKADPTQLQQVIINVCANAVHAMSEKGLLKIGLDEIDLADCNTTFSTVHQVDKYAELSILDTGSGMNKETIDQIFDPFFTTQSVGEGTGMGLSVVHGIVEQHDGFIIVDSTPGQGSNFKIYFPITSETKATIKTDATEPIPTGTESILFVDDEESLAYSSKELLEFQGYKVTSVLSSNEALELFKASPDSFDLVFTDQTMPEMSGAELATELLKIRPALPIILCSGYSSKISEEDAKEIGIREYCMKPMNMEQLAIVARKVLDASDS